MHKIVNDTRRIHADVCFLDGERRENTLWGDSRLLTVQPVDYEVPDLTLSQGYSHRGKAMRVRSAEFTWQRKKHWGFGIWGNRGFNSDHTEGWTLTRIRVEGPNVKKDDTTGALDLSEVFYRATLDKAPQWVRDLVAEHDPAITGSPLDEERAFILETQTVVNL